jgi:UDP-N-acetylglucosamine acyltransferase
MKVHPTAIVAPDAQLGEGVQIGAYAIIENDVIIGAETVIGSQVLIAPHTRIGQRCQIYPFAVLGTQPQDLKFQGEESRVVIGDDNVIREYVTIHRGTRYGDYCTTVGSRNYIMAYSHIAHDCKVGNEVIMANVATLAGHIHLDDYSIIGGLVAIHQFVRIGKYAFVGGKSAVSKDIPPYVIASGDRAKLYGLNLVGLKRRGFGAETLETLKQAYRILFRSHGTLKEALEKIAQELPRIPELDYLVDFINTSQRGITR